MSNTHKMLAVVVALAVFYYIWTLKHGGKPCSGGCHGTGGAAPGPRRAGQPVATQGTAVMKSQNTVDAFLAVGATIPTPPPVRRRPSSEG